IALLDSLRIERVKAIGLSGGGITLLHMATARPACLEAMVVVSAPPYFPAQARALQRGFSESALSEGELDLLRKRHRRGGNQVARRSEQGRASAGSYDDVSFPPPPLGTIAAETLVVFGDRDPFYPVALAFELYAAIPRSYLWVVPNAGHGPVFGDAAPRFAET